MVTSLQKLSEYLEKQRRSGLVPKKIRVHREGKEFERTQWVRPEEIEKPSKVTKEEIDIIDKTIRDLSKIHRDDKPEHMKRIRQKIHGEQQLKKLDNMFSEHTENTVSKGSAMIRVCAGLLIGIDKNEIRQSLKQELDQQRFAYNERYKKVHEEHPELGRPISEEEVDNMIKSAFENIDEQFLNSFTKEQALSQEYLKQYLKTDKVKICRGVRGNLVANIKDKIKNLSDGDEIEISNGLVSGFTFDPDYTKQFGDIALTTEIPIEKVIYAFDFKEGQKPTPEGYGEHEVLVSGRDANRFKVGDIKIWK